MSDLSGKSNPAGPATGADHALWRERLAPYARAHDGRAAVAVLTSVVPYLALSVAMYLALQVSRLAGARARASSGDLPRADVHHLPRLLAWLVPGGQACKRLARENPWGVPVCPVRALAPRPRGPSRFLGRPGSAGGGRRPHAHGRRIPSALPARAAHIPADAQPGRDAGRWARWSRS